MVRDAAGWRAVTWDDVFHTVAQRFRELGDRCGPDVLGRPRRRGRRTRTITCCRSSPCRAADEQRRRLRVVCHSPSVAALGAIFGTGAVLNSFDDIEAAATILVCGANPTENHPIVGARIKQATRQGAALIVVDPRRIELADSAAIHLRPRPGTNVLVFNAMSVIIEEGLVDETFARERVDGLDEFARHVTRYAPSWSPTIAASMPPTSGPPPACTQPTVRRWHSTGWESPNTPKARTA